MKQFFTPVLATLTVYAIAVTVASADPYAADRQNIVDSAGQTVLINDPTSVQTSDDGFGQQTLSTRSLAITDIHENLNGYGGR